MFKPRQMLRRRICAGFVVLALGLASGHSQDLSVAQQLEGMPGEVTSRLSATSAANAANMVSDYQADWAAFVHEVDGTYPFFELKGIRADWEKAKLRFAEAVRTCKSDRQFVGLVTDAMRLLRDAHMGFSQLKAPRPERPKLFYPGISFMPATQGRVVVMMAEQAQLAPLRPGTIVTRIDGRNAREVLEANAKAAWGPDSAYPVFVSSPQRARLFAYRWPLLTASNCTHQLHYLAEGQERELTLTCATEPRGWPHTYNAPTNLARAEGAVSYTQLASGAGYIYLRSVAEGTPAGLRRALAAHPGAKGWILDLRGNGGGGYDTNLLTTLQTIPQPVVALLDAGCISAGETLVRDLAQLAQAHLIGARTAGASSSKRQWTFPSGLGTVTFSTRSRWRADGQPIEFNGVQPDEEVEAVPEEVARGLNSELLRAEAYLARKR